MANARTISRHGRRLSARVLGEAFATILQETSEQRMPEAVRACAQFIQRAGLLHRSPAVLTALDEALFAEQGLCRVPLATAEPLDEKDQVGIETALEAVVGSPVRVKVSVRPWLLAGFRAETRDLLIDASLQGTLFRLRARWHGGASPSTSSHA